jgi:hypothetical protein
MPSDYIRIKTAKAGLFGIGPKEEDILVDHA